MTDPEAEKAALAWLNAMEVGTVPGGGAEQAVRTLRAMVARPVLPEEFNVRGAAEDAISALGHGVAPSERTFAMEAIRLYHNHLFRRLTAKPPRFELETHYTTAAHPTRSTFDTADEALEQAGARLRCHAGVSHTVVRPVKS